MSAIFRILHKKTTFFLTYMYSRLKLVFYEAIRTLKAVMAGEG